MTTICECHLTRFHGIALRILTAHNFMCDKRAQQNKTKWRLFFYATWLATEVSGALRNNNCIISQFQEKYKTLL